MLFRNSCSRSFQVYTVKKFVLQGFPTHALKKFVLQTGLRIFSFVLKNKVETGNPGKWWKLLYHFPGFWRFLVHDAYHCAPGKNHKNQYSQPYILPFPFLDIFFWNINELYSLAPICRVGPGGWSARSPTSHGIWKLWSAWDLEQSRWCRRNSRWWKLWVNLTSVLFWYGTF